MWNYYKMLKSYCGLIGWQNQYQSVIGRAPGRWNVLVSSALVEKNASFLIHYRDSIKIQG